MGSALDFYFWVWRPNFQRQIIFETEPISLSLFLIYMQFVKQFKCAYCHHKAKTPLHLFFIFIFPQHRFSTSEFGTEQRLLATPDWMGLPSVTLQMFTWHFIWFHLCVLKHSLAFSSSVSSSHHKQLFFLNSPLTCTVSSISLSHFLIYL